jgi:GDP-D-mannose 3',5'-epimerase
MIIDVAGKNIQTNNIRGPTGVRGRNSDNNLLKEKLAWEPSIALRDGITRLYNWICQDIELNNASVEYDD